MRILSIFMFIEAQFTIAKTWIQPRWPLTDDYINEMRYIYTMKYQSARKNQKAQ